MLRFQVFRKESFKAKKSQFPLLPVDRPDFDNKFWISSKRKRAFIRGWEKTHLLPDFKGALFISSMFVFGQGVQSKLAPKYEKLKMSSNPVSVYVSDTQKVPYYEFSGEGTEVNNTECHQSRKQNHSCRPSVVSTSLHRLQTEMKVFISVEQINFATN